jgi:hypothetical protein
LAKTLIFFARAGGCPRFRPLPLPLPLLPGDGDRDGTAPDAAVPVPQRDMDLASETGVADVLALVALDVMIDHDGHPPVACRGQRKEPGLPAAGARLKRV